MKFLHTGILKDVTDFLYPRVCIVSENSLSEENSNRFISDEILSNLTRVTKKQSEELKNKLKADYVYSHYDFPQKSDFEKIIHHLKYTGMKSLGNFLGEHLAGYAKLELDEINEKFDFIIPVPLHKTKVRERGYNQSEFIAKGVSDKLNIPLLTNAISRTRYTKSQTKLNLIQRAENMKDAFKVNEANSELLKNKNIILLDDVITTGATVNECISVLKIAGVNKIFALSLAMAE